MQKKLIALAVAGLVSGGAFAQAANVTIAGVVDVGYRHSSSGGQSKSGIDSTGGLAGSRLIFKGTEDLGGGTSALFNLEYGTLAIDGPTGISTTRQSYVGLTGSFGTVVAGRLQPMAKSFSDKYDAMAATWFSAENAMTSLSGSTVNSSVRLNNAVAYVSPAMSGLTAQFAYSFAGLASADTTQYGTVAMPDQERVLGIGFDYSAGPFAAGLIYHKASNVAGVKNSDAKDYALGASYDFGMAKVAGGWRSIDRTGQLKDKVMDIGVSVPVNKMDTVMVGYGKFTDGAAAAKDASSLGVVYRHNLSKRTATYVGYQRVSNDKGALGAVFGNGAVVAGSNSSGYGAGVMHSF